MANVKQDKDNSSPLCKVCGEACASFDETTVLKKYLVKYFRCEACGFIQTEKPYWLNEAYSSAIARQDVGIMHRNLLNLELTSAVLNLLYPNISKAIDYGGGHGIFVRLMRDRGFDFSWYDSYASNDYARGFESDSNVSYDFLTAFEVLEHLTDPLDELSKMMSLSANIFVSTLLVPEPAPRVSDWWYYVPSTGQHVAFYTLESLRRIATHFGKTLLSNGTYHLFSNDARSNLLFKLATNSKAALILNRLRKRSGFVESDFYKMIQPD